jgi:hypothetical protein
MDKCLTTRPDWSDIGEKKRLEKWNNRTLEKGEKEKDCWESGSKEMAISFFCPSILPIFQFFLDG